MISKNKKNKIDKIINNIYEELGKKDTYLHEPHIFGNELKYVKSCLEDNSISSFGKYIKKFEKILLNYTNAKYCVSTVNGTSGLTYIFTHCRC